MELQLLYAIITLVIMMGVLQGCCAYLVLLERKVSAYVQDRIGPNRVGPFGLLQPIADGVKFLLKEEIIPGNVDKLFFMVAPSIALITAMVAFAVVPFGPTSVPPTPPPLGASQEQVLAYQQSQAFKDYQQTYQFVIAPNVNIGILFVLAVGSLNVYAIILGGWSSNNKYSFLGALRSSAQLISYEIPMGMSILGVILLTGSVNLEQIIQRQTTDGWFVLYQPLACLIFLICIFAENNRLPFDLAEAEQELVGGYHTEYNGMKLALFFLGEYTHMITTGLLLMVLFFGVWHCPGIDRLGLAPIAAAVVGVIVVVVKVFAFIMFSMLIRWTIPRFRFDQLMGLAWKMLIPLALINLVLTAVVRELGWTPWVLLPVSIVVLVAAAILSLRPPAPRGGVPARDGQPLETAAS